MLLVSVNINTHILLFGCQFVHQLAANIVMKEQES